MGKGPGKGSIGASPGIFIFSRQNTKKNQEIKELKNINKKLEKTINEMIYYSIKGDGYREAKKDFEERHNYF